MLTNNNHLVNSTFQVTLNLTLINSSSIFAAYLKKMRTLIQSLAITLLTSALNICTAQTKQDSVKKEPVKPSEEKKTEWYQKISLRGYVQARYNRLLETNGKLQNEQGDRSVGNNGGFFLRRARLTFSGQVHPKVFFYIQSDYSQHVDANNQNYVQLRDAYFDLGVDKDNEFRFRIGQSKVPYGFDNIQSSSIRLTFDRSDAINSGMYNERDLGVFFYWAPKEKRKLFKHLAEANLKGSGDYGVFALGVFNGQTTNKAEANNTPHVVSRFTYPVAIGKQIIEPGIQAYTGKFVTTAASTGVITKNSKAEYLDQRVAASFVLYPQPFGIQAEYNWGTGPEYNSSNNSIAQKHLEGGYVTASYRVQDKDQSFIPFARYQYYTGGKKPEKDARSYNVHEFEFGAEWQMNKNFEFTAAYDISKRKFEDSARPFNWQKGNFLRLQAQLNF